MFGLPASSDVIASRLLRRAVAPAVVQAREALIARQRSDGYWLGTLSDDSFREAQWVLMSAFLGNTLDPRIEQAAQRLEQTRLTNGGWSRRPAGTLDLSGTIQSYVALKIAGRRADTPTMQAIAARIVEHGGVSACDATTRYLLAILGQLPFDDCPAIPPEIVLMPSWTGWGIGNVRATARTCLVPLSIVWANRPVRALPSEHVIPELFATRTATAAPGWWSARRTYLRADWWIKRFERRGMTPLRKRACRKATTWLREHYVDSDGLGAHFSAMMWNLIAMRTLGVGEHEEAWLWGMMHLDALMHCESGALRIQETVMPIRDTALSLIALAEAGEGPDSPAVRQGVRRLLDHEVRRPGDAGVGLDRGGWCAQFRNGFYPDVWTTATVLLSLEKTGHARTAAARPAVQRGLEWLLAMQQRDGGWGAYDRRTSSRRWDHVAFADACGMRDGGCPDITGRVLECLAYFGYRMEHDCVRRAMRFLESSQTSAGSWSGRWGVGPLFGTWSVLEGIAKMGPDPHGSMMRNAAQFLKRGQHQNGGWSEPDGEAGPTQTAWAILGLIAAGESDSAAVQSGLGFLSTTQHKDGTWNDLSPNARGIMPNVVGTHSHFSICFPLTALARGAHRRTTAT